MAVLLIFFILILIGFVFYVKIMSGNVEFEAGVLREKEGIKIAQRALFLPELQCSEENVVKSDCVDIMKLNTAAQVMLDNEFHYHSKLGFSEITITQVYPDTEESWQIYDRGLDVDAYRDIITTHMPVTLFDPSTDNKAFGVMEVRVYTR